MNEIFGVDIAAIVNDTFAGNLHPLTLHKITSTVGEYGEPVNSEAGYSGEGVRTKWKSEIMVARGYAMGTVKIIILQNGIVTPTKADEITILSERFRIVDIEQDPVNATWAVAGVKA